MSIFKEKTIITTCAADKASKIKCLLIPKGAEVFEFPMIHISQSQNSEEVKSVIKKIHTYNWIIFTSSKGVSNFFLWLHQFDIFINKSNVKFAVIGKSTGKILKKLGFEANYISESKDSKSFAEELITIIGNEKANILLPIGNLSENRLFEVFKKKHHVTSLEVYQTKIPLEFDDKIYSKIINNKYDLIFFLSPSAVENFLILLGDKINISTIKGIAIGKTTSKAMIKHGIKPLFTPKTPNIESMIEEFEALKKNKKLI
jgi:uroporphyrinogen-III synthase